MSGYDNPSTVEVLKQQRVSVTHHLVCCGLFVVIAAFHGCSNSSTTLVVERATAENIPEYPGRMYADPWESIIHFHWDAPRLSREQQQFVSGLQHIMAGDYTEAEKSFQRLALTSMNPLTKAYAQKVYAHLLFHRSQWNEIAALRSAVTGEDTSLATNNSLAEIFSRYPAETYVFPEHPVVVPMNTSSSGSPMIEVTVNGKKFHFWLDTGAGLSVVSSDVAEELGLTIASDTRLRAGTATSKKVRIQPTMIDSLEIGGVMIRNHPAIVIHKRNLTFRLLGFIPVLKIDGIIGWNAIKNFRMELNYSEKTVTLQKPVTRRGMPRNFFWCGYPIVQLTSSKGHLLYFGFDSGARRSSIRESIFHKMDIRPAAQQQETVGSAGGFENIQSSMLDSLEVIVNGWLLRFSNIPTMPAMSSAVVAYDGILGIDIAKQSSVVLDFHNGYFGYEYLGQKE